MAVPLKKSHSASLLALAAGALALSACISPMTDTHGFIPDEAKPADIKPGEDTRTTVLAKLGSPTMEDAFEGERWYYVSSVQQRRAYQKPKTTEREITEIAFNEEGEVTEVNIHGMENAQKVAFVNDKTPTRGRELTVLEQLLGNVGRLPGDIASEEGPGN